MSLTETEKHRSKAAALNLHGTAMQREVPDTSAVRNDCTRNSVKINFIFLNLKFGVMQSEQSDETEERNCENGKCNSSDVFAFRLSEQ